MRLSALSLSSLSFHQAQRPSRTSHRVHLTHVDKMFPHTLLPCRIFDFG
nr:MAG TPA: hypothetical protein [Caudoviricetes sp.]